MKSNIISIVLSTLIVAIIVESTSVDNCVTDPTTPSCVNYELPGAIVTADVDDLCTQMPFMIGCSVENMCESSSIESSIYCAKFSIYKDLCLDMPKMSGCSDYTSMCGNGSVVKECDTAVVGFPSTMQTQSYITSICDQMTMAGCTECTADMSSCDLLSTYSSLCKAMPDMTQCAAWKSYCVNIPDWDICSYSSADSPPEMRMYFHTGILDYILFKEWVPRTVGSYAGSCIAVFVMGFLSEAIKAFRCYCDKMWKKQSGGYSQRKFYHISLDVDVPRAIFRLVEYTYAMLVMLVIMTYNVGLFICVCAGVGVGNLFMGRYMNYEEQPEDASCCC